MLGRCRNPNPGHPAAFPRECRVRDGVRSGIGTAAAPVRPSRCPQPAAGSVPSGCCRSPLPALDLKALNETSSASGLRSCLMEWFNIPLEELGRDSVACHTPLCHTAQQPLEGCGGDCGHRDKTSGGFTEHHSKPRCCGGRNTQPRSLGIYSLGDRDAPTGTVPHKAPAAVPCRLLPCGCRQEAPPSLSSAGLAMTAGRNSLARPAPSAGAVRPRLPLHSHSELVKRRVRHPGGLGCPRDSSGEGMVMRTSPWALPAGSAGSRGQMEPGGGGGGRGSRKGKLVNKRPMFAFPPPCETAGKQGAEMVEFP